MLKILFFGMSGAFSVAPLAGLVAAGADICGVVLPASGRQPGRSPRLLPAPPPPPLDLPLADPFVNRTILHLAWANAIPAWEVSGLSGKATLEMLASLEPDLACVACFPFIFPPTLLKLPRRGCLNLHPSILPAYRGPAPLYWIIRRRETRAGVTLHVMDEGADSGDIVSQAVFDLSHPITETELERRCAAAGAQLLAAAVKQLERSGRLPRRPQPEAGASYFPLPPARE